MSKSKHFLRFIIYGTFCYLMIAATACRRNEESLSNSQVTIHLFKNENPAISIPVEKDDENGWKTLLNIDLSQSDFIIHEHDIINYDWSLQKITLNNDLKTRFEYNSYGALDYDYFLLALGENPIVGGNNSSDVFSRWGEDSRVVHFQLFPTGLK